MLGTCALPYSYVARTGVCYLLTSNSVRQTTNIPIRSILLVVWATTPSRRIHYVSRRYQVKVKAFASEGKPKLTMVMSCAFWHLNSLQGNEVAFVAHVGSPDCTPYRAAAAHSM